MAGDTLVNLEMSLRETIRKEAGDHVKQAKALAIQKEAWGNQTRQALEVSDSLSKLSSVGKDDPFNSTENSLQTKEEEIKKRKAEVEQRVKIQVSRVEQEAKKLDELRKELDSIEDPTKKEVADLRKKIEAVDRELRPMKALCEKKDKELKDALSAYNNKSAQKQELVGRLFEIVTESERMRLEKLEELNRHLQTMEARSNGL